MRQNLADRIACEKLSLHEVVINAGAQVQKDGPLLTSETSVEDLVYLFKVRLSHLALVKPKLMAGRSLDGTEQYSRTFDRAQSSRAHHEVVDRRGEANHSHELFPRLSHHQSNNRLADILSDQDCNEHARRQVGGGADSRRYQRFDDPSWLGSGESVIWPSLLLHLTERVCVIHGAQTDMGGPRASITVEESVRGMIKVFESKEGMKTGQFLNYKGETLAW